MICYDNFTYSYMILYDPIWYLLISNCIMLSVFATTYTKHIGMYVTACYRMLMGVIPFRNICGTVCQHVCVFQIPYHFRCSQPFQTIPSLALITSQTASHRISTFPKQWRMRQHKCSSCGLWLTKEIGPGNLYFSCGRWWQTEKLARSCVLRNPI